MKHLFVLVVIISLSATNCVARNKVMAKQMQDFFLKTLKENYKSESIENSYFLFLNDFLEKKGKLSLKIDTTEIKKINKKLKKKRYYSYYYKTLRVIDNSEKWDSLISSKSSNSKKGYKNVKPLDSSDKSIPSLVVFLNKSGHYKHIMKNNELLSFNEIEISYEHTPYLDFYLVSRVFMHFEDDLEETIVREFISVVFWRFLCNQAGIQFIKKEYL